MKNEGSRVLVTGANGFIGRHLCRFLDQYGYEVRALQRQKQKPIKDVTTDGAQIFIGDINDSAILEKAMEGVNCVFHLAGIAHVEGSNKSLLQSVNVDGTATLLAAAKLAGVSKIIYFSSGLAGNVVSHIDIVTNYARSKYMAEQLLLNQGTEQDPQVCILRPVNVYGVGMKGSLSRLIRLIGQGVLPPLPTVKSQFSLISVKDLCHAAVLASLQDIANGKTYVVTDGMVYYFNDIERAIYQALGKRKPAWSTPRVMLYAASVLSELAGKIPGINFGFSRRTYQNLVGGKTYSNSLICRELGFESTTTFYDALPRIVSDIGK